MEVTALHGLLAGSLLVYGTVHGAIVALVWYRYERMLVPVLLFVSPVGVGAGILAAVPFIGLLAALTVAIACAIGFLPVAIIMWLAVLWRKEGLQ